MIKGPISMYRSRKFRRQFNPQRDQMGVMLIWISVLRVTTRQYA